MTGEKLLEHYTSKFHYWGCDIEANGFATILAVDKVDDEL
jgi:hypothetical protein